MITQVHQAKNTGVEVRKRGVLALSRTGESAFKLGKAENFQRDGER